MHIVAPEEATNGSVALSDRIVGDFCGSLISDSISRLSEQITRDVIRHMVEPVAEALPEEIQNE